MSYLLYLHGVNWPTFEGAFRAKPPNVVAVIKAMNLSHLRQRVFSALSDEQVTLVVTNALTRGVDYGAASATDSRLIDVIVDRAFGVKALGIKTVPLSPMGVGAGWLDELEGAFDAHGANALWRALRNGKRLGEPAEKRATEGAQFLLTPDEVSAANEKIQSIARGEGEPFGSELAEPFAKATKKKLGMRGLWG